MGETIYLDYNASTPCDPRVVEAMLPFFTEVCANPASRTHGPGRRAGEAVEAARSTVARMLGARSSAEIVFTSGATESNNIAIAGYASTLGPRRRHLITQATEHPSVLEPVRQLAAAGWEVTVVGVDSDGRLRLDELRSALRTATALVSVMHANNETGTVQPIAEVVQLAREGGSLVHCDAAQAAGKIPLDVAASGIDLLSLSGHKLCGPKGIGALYVRRLRPPLRLRPLVHGGGQEGGVRSGTVNVPGGVGLACALEIAAAERTVETERVANLRDRLEAAIVDRLDGVTRNGCLGQRLPGTSNLSFAGVDGEALLVALGDLAIGTGSACSSAQPEPSYVLRAMGVPMDLAAASLRFSLGRFTTTDEVDRAADRVVEEVHRLRQKRRR